MSIRKSPATHARMTNTTTVATVRQGVSPQQLDADQDRECAGAEEVEARRPPRTYFPGADQRDR